MITRSEGRCSYEYKIDTHHLVTAYCVSLETSSSSITNTTASSVHLQLKSLSIEPSKISVRTIKPTINNILLICVQIYYYY